MPTTDYFKKLFFAFLFFYLSCLFPLSAESLDVQQKLDQELLSRIEKDSLQYFIRMSDKISGLTRDSSRPGSPASIAATGFSLAAISIGESRGWIPQEQAQAQLRKTLETLLKKAAHKNGFFYHFLDPRSGRRVWSSEASSIDTALLAAGALLAGQYHPGTTIERMARQIYERIDWPWMMNGSLLMCMGWTPEGKFLPYYWDSYNEHLLIQALAIGSPTHPIPKEAWNEWLRNEDDYQGLKVIYSASGSLFTYQYPQAFIDFKNLNDRGINYHQNSIQAAQANRLYALEKKDSFENPELLWGISASVGPGGYKAYGGLPGAGLFDGTIAPYAVISALIFTPGPALDSIRFMFNQYHQNLYGRFGFKDAFHLKKKWWAEEYLGIDQGITVLMIENYLNDGDVWKKFMLLKPVQKWIGLCELQNKDGVSLPS